MICDSLIMVFRPSGLYVWKINTWNYKSIHAFACQVHYMHEWNTLQIIRNAQNLFQLYEYVVEVIPMLVCFVSLR